MASSSSTIPLNFRTVAFCFLMGTILGPLADLVIPARFQIFIPPKAWMVFHDRFWIGCVILLPFWSFIMVRRYDPLALIGSITFILAFLALLFPAISS